MTATNDPKRRALGRGLDTLLPQRQSPPPVLETVEANGRPLEIACDLIDRNPFQTRTHFDEARLEELTQSVIASGVVQPIVVRPIADGRYQLITGERRLLASKKAGKATIPSIVRKASDEQAMEMTIVENLQRADLNPMEQARAYQRLSREFSMTQDQIAVRTGKDRASVSNFLRLLRLPEDMQSSVEAGVLSFGHARALLGLETAERIRSASAKVVALSMSVRQTESYVQGLLNPEQKQKRPAKEARAIDPNVRDAQELMQRRLGLKVSIEDKKGRGRVIIEYAGLEDFDALMASLGGALPEG